jgi:uncharacterized protein (TIGR00369 family)
MTSHPAAPLIEKIPANQLLGIAIEKMDSGAAEVRLPWRNDLGNHIGSFHVAPLFGLADATSGAAMISGLGDLMATVTPLARGGDIQFKKPARGDIVGRCTITAAELDTIRAEIDAEGVSRPVATVEMVDADGTVVASADFRWHVKKNA